MTSGPSIVESQLVSLDDTDCYASAWADAVKAAADSDSSRLKNLWGGRGKGGRQLSRRTIQPHTVVLDDVRLEYVNDKGLPGKVLLEGATLKLLSRHVYSLLGRNGCGKSTLLRRINAGKVPGFPTHLSSMYVPQEVLMEPDKTPMDIVLSHHDKFVKESSALARSNIEKLEARLEQLDMTSEDDADEMETLCQQISQLEDELEDDHNLQLAQQQAQDSLRFFGVDETSWNTPSERLSGGQRKKVQLASALLCKVDLLLLDEPTNFLDIGGLIQLRRLISTCVDRNTTVLLVSHDVDLINDVATDVIHFTQQTLVYYPGNYRDYLGYKQQKDLHRLRQYVALEKKRDAMLQTLDHLKKQPTPKRGGAKKKGRQIESVKKKLEKQGIERDEKGHRWKQQKAGTGIKEGSINAVDASARSSLSHAQLLKRAETKVAPVPDKAVQFVFRNTTCTWGGPLIVATDVGHGYGPHTSTEEQSLDTLTKRPGFLFDCVDLCINEGSITCILGENGSGKSTLLRLLAKVEQPLEGTVSHAQGLSIGYFDQHVVDTMIETSSDETLLTALSLLAKRFPSRTEKELRGELTSFGISPKQALTDIRFLSGGERSRVCLAALMLADPQLLIMDEPSSHLDVESVEALIYGLKQWNGTLIMVSHDSHLIRSLDGTCHVIMPLEGKVRKVPDGIDSYLKAFTF